jgi:hypothetical protein
MEAIIGGIVGLVIGAAATKMVMGVASSAGTVARTVAKEVIKGGLVIQEAASDMCSGSGNYFSDIITEAKAELAATSAGETMPAAQGAGH